MLIVVGLGNPGLKYKRNYHNMGYMTIDKIADKLGVEFKKKACDARIAETFINGEKIILAKPLTYMNNSGVSVKELVGAYKAKTQEVLVIYDDIDIEAGALRLRAKGKAGTHNGMRSIVAEIGEDFPRMRVGIGKSEQMPLVDYVLSNVAGENKEILDNATTLAAQAIVEYVSQRNIELIGNRYNGKR